jgi:hypothetical protein
VIYGTDLRFREYGERQEDRRAQEYVYLEFATTCYCYSGLKRNTSESPRRTVLEVQHVISLW